MVSLFSNFKWFISRTRRRGRVSSLLLFLYSRPPPKAWGNVVDAKGKSFNSQVSSTKHRNFYCLLFAVIFGFEHALHFVKCRFVTRSWKRTENHSNLWILWFCRRGSTSIKESHVEHFIKYSQFTAWLKYICNELSRTRNGLVNFEINWINLLFKQRFSKLAGVGWFKVIALERHWITLFVFFYLATRSTRRLSIAPID